jgi:hypothetical protein
VAIIVQSFLPLWEINRDCILLQEVQPLSGIRLHNEGVGGLSLWPGRIGDTVLYYSGVRRSESSVLQESKMLAFARFTAG